MKPLRILFFPLAWLYQLITSIYHFLYDKKILKSTGFAIPIISVGNLAVGGTGKTPMVESLVRLLKDQYKIVILSRGYKRETRGFRFVNKKDTPFSVGDEAFQIYKKFDTMAHVAVGEKRVPAIQKIIAQKPDTNLILLDDAFQHRSLVPGLSILLSSYQNFFSKDHLMPVGRLRENKRGAKRADIIITTKCPDHITEKEMHYFEKEASKYSNAPIFFTGISYSKLISLGNKKDIDNNVLLVSGIAQTKSLVNYIKKHYTLYRHIRFGDHHEYTIKDVLKIKDIIEASKNEPISIITTEKDLVKLIQPEFIDVVKTLPLFYLAIVPFFIKDEKHFNKYIYSFVEKSNNE